MTKTYKNLDSILINQLDIFSKTTNFSNLYKQYRWKNDIHANGFPDIKTLELVISSEVKSTGITLEAIKAVVKWGSPDKSRINISGEEIAIPNNSFVNKSDDPDNDLSMFLYQSLRALMKITGIGPTYQSKVIRFAMPDYFGAIDTRCVRIFGQGDDEHQQHSWLNLAAIRGKHKSCDDRWYIPKTKKLWPAEYEKWNNILRYFTDVLPPNCPHPPGFIDSGLRNKGVWLCADVEMALFSYASQFLK